MKKLLIVDDEQIEREGLQAILHKAFPDLIMEQAKNGKVAVQMAQALKPDLVLMDISMPGMNGLEAVEQISAKDPSIKFIMVTAHDTFEYARQALKLGVKDYLLKPSKVSEIIETVGRVLKQIDTLQKALPLVETDVVTQLLFDHVHEVHLNELISLLNIQRAKEMFVMIVLLPQGSEGYYSAIKERARKARNCWVGALYGRQLPIIVFREQDKSFRSQAVTLASEILSIVQSDIKANWFIGIGNPCNSLDQIRKSYHESLIATMDTTIPARYRLYTDVSVRSSERESQLSKLQEKQFFDNIRLGQWDQIRLEVSEFIQRYENESADLLQTQQRVLELLWTASRILNEMDVETDIPLFSFQAQDYRQLRSETALLLDGMQRSYAEHYEQLEPDTIYQIKQYIIEHSHKDISLETIGKKVGLSPFYISKLFKEQLGINYIDFLTECRIEKAKKLMSDPEKSLKEIAYEVGYHDPNYFSKVFKKVCDLSPTEYRNTLLGKKADKWRA